ncbi:DoxX family protein [Kineococcus rubinsiae]|uniref:DoxX family protein n=1 Tax=Kineococcus rubinsiae TaxID=2609562 RepID=UPI001431227A|nr:DoxX family protein [Kineococcus rubinsiae]NIZ89660.1 DoxX family protein [Kineococcus rubinsiae]
MFIATIIVSALMALVLISSAAGKLQGKDAIVQQMGNVGVTGKMIPALGVIEIAGAIGLIAGLFWAPIGIAAAIGVILYFVGAVIAHVRAHDSAIAPPAVLALVAVAALVLRVLSA